MVNSECNNKYCNCGTELRWNIKNNSYRRFCPSGCAQDDDTTKTKRETTCKKKFGYKTNLMTPAAKKAYAEEMIRQFGVDNPFKSATVQQDIRDYWMDEFGVSNPIQLPGALEKAAKTSYRKYGRRHKNQMHLSLETIEIKSNKEKLQALYDTGLSITDIANQLKCGLAQLAVQFKKFGIELRKSSGQKQMCEFIKTLYADDILYDDRKALHGKEIDILLPKSNIGFEYDGIFWHCENTYKHKNYHMNKDKLAVKEGVRLFHFIDLEWIKKQDIVKSYILDVLNIEKPSFNTNFTTCILSKDEADKFFNENHLEETINATHYYGLKSNGIIVSAMSFNKIKTKCELLRFCNLINYKGDDAKLFNYAINELKVKTITVNSNIRYETDDRYLSLGFKFVKDTKPTFFYTYNYDTIQRKDEFTKDNLIEQLEEYDPSLTEWENMKLHDFDRYWNSGYKSLQWCK